MDIVIYPPLMKTVCLLALCKFDSLILCVFLSPCCSKPLWNDSDITKNKVGQSNFLFDPQKKGVVGPQEKVLLHSLLLCFSSYLPFFFWLYSVCLSDISESVEDKRMKFKV